MEPIYGRIELPSMVPPDSAEHALQIRSIPMDEQTQVGNLGSSPQVLKQRAHTGDEYFEHQNHPDPRFSPRTTGKCHEQCSGACKECSSSQPDSCCLDECTDEDGPTAHPLWLASSKLGGA